ncbi:insulinase family protein [Hyunsoonleella sp. SJ7]|uniref:Insulinase family protein n=1 Tax=Hyunsoonleella aquatilis TaxID=2762758 RepID=A0A923KHY6_9FLAO|nr:insulinase family protein [Hyunsoonleella aquatilis]MBC3757584.1 insulinase family protein [Hyunsoonleella aquatilis]
MKKTVLFAISLFLFVSNYILAQNASLAQKIPISNDVKIGKLSNGLTYYIRNNKKPEDKLELRLVVNAGSILEDNDQQGLAHFMEHMNFNGTKNFERNDLVDYLQSIGVTFGADLNAYTSFDETVYILPIPSDDPEKLDKGFQILEDWAHNATLDHEEIDKERGVVLEEYRLGQGADKRMLQNYLPKVLYGSKYASRLPIGKKDVLENFDYDVLKRFYKDWYRPDLMAVIAVGDIDVATLEEKIKQHFNTIPKAENPREREVFYLPNHKETFIAIESDNEAPISRVQVLFKDSTNVKQMKTLEDYKKGIIKSLFTRMINNRLDELRNGENPPFVYGASYHGRTWAKTKAAYQSFAVTSETGQLDALKTLLIENERVRQHGFFKGEFNRAKQNILARLEKAFKDKDKNMSRNIVGEYVRHFLNGEPIPGIAWEHEFHKTHLPDIKLEDVNNIINDFVKDENRVIVITGPEKEGIAKVTDTQVLDLLKHIKTIEIEPYNDKEVAQSLMSKIPEEGSILDEVHNDILGTTTLTLSNGMTVTYKNTDFKNDEILFSSFSYGGTSLYSLEDYKATSYANGALSEAGVNGFDKIELGKMLSGKIVSVRPSIGNYSEAISGSASPKYLEDMFQLIHLYFTALNKDDKAFASFINKQKAIIKNLLSNPQYYFRIEFSKFLNQDNPRYVGFPSEEDLDNADYDLAHKLYNQRFKNAGDFNFYFVGNIDEEIFKAYCKTYLASLPSETEKENYKLPEHRPLTGSHTKIIEKGTDPKSSVRIVYQGETEYNPEETRALRSLGEILTIKLVEKLREEESDVYGVGARGNISKVPYGRYNFSISFPCGPENVDKLIKVANNELKKIIENGPTEKDLAKVKESQILKTKQNLKKNKYWLNRLKNSDYNKQDLSKIFEYEERINALTAEQVQAVGKKYLSKGYILGIHNPEKPE